MKYGTLFVVFFITFTAFTQKKAKSDTLAITEQKKSTADSVKKHSILKAALFSAVIPGAGQIYNSIAMPKGQKKAYWKVPLIYAGLGVTGYFGVKNAITTKSLKIEYKFRESTNFTQMNDSKWLTYDKESLAELYKKYSNQRNWCFIGMGIVYLLQVADAAVEAHFVTFDISENLALQLQPTILNNPYNATNVAGINIALKFKK
jgi:hypothetical protein